MPLRFCPGRSRPGGPSHVDGAHNVGGDSIRRPSHAPAISRNVMALGKRRSPPFRVCQPVPIRCQRPSSPPLPCPHQFALRQAVREAHPAKRDGHHPPGMHIAICFLSRAGTLFQQTDGTTCRGLSPRELPAASAPAIREGFAAIRHPACRTRDMGNAWRNNDVRPG